MNRPLQPFEHDRSRYERPNQKWGCGWQAEGEPCAGGPQRGGRCGTVAECSPLREGDRWRCTRPEDLGGPCRDGPKPDGSCSRPLVSCQPVLCIRARRGALTRWAATATVGLLLLVSVGPIGRGFFSPGPLAVAHSGLEDACEACHVQGASLFAGLLGAVLGSATGPVSDVHCLTCHDLGPHADLAHSVAAEALERSPEGSHNSDNSGGSAVTSELRVGGLLARPAVAAGSPIHCIACHTDHDGRLADLSKLSDEQCQVCHRKRFNSFSEGHPDFAITPKGAPGALDFDHAAHNREHFPGSGRPFRCGACHPSNVGAASPSASLPSEPCAECHGGAFPAPKSGRWAPPHGETDRSATLRPFSHSRHVADSLTEPCGGCHVPALDTGDASPAPRSPDFRPIGIQVCQRCHAARAAGQACLLCHVYHIPS